MSAPYLSVVVPALNEEACIGSFIERMRAELVALVPSWEILVVDDGSTDRTREIVEAATRADARVRLLTGPHRGKGAAVRQGLAAARGAWRFMADADLSMPPDNLARFLALARGPNPPDLAIGSREAPGARRSGERPSRRAIGRLFNWSVRLLALPGIRDTQCGFKLFSARAVEQLVPQLTVDGFAFDVEMLFLARRSGFSVREVGITWQGRDETRVALGRGVAAFMDILRIRARWRNRHAVRAYLLASACAAALAYGLVRLPVQVSDSLGEILDAQRSPSVAASFEASLGSAGYLRPLRIAQIKWLYDAANGRYHLMYRGVHALLATAAVFLFVRAMRVRTASDLSAAAFALVVLTGHHTFLGTVREAFPINHFLEIVVACLAVANLALARPAWWTDAAACLIFAAAALTLESGLLVWVAVVAARASGLRGVSWRGVAAMTLLLGGYFYVRFVVFPTGAPGLGERNVPYFFEVIERTEVSTRFGDNPFRLYAYNIVASLGSVLIGEPQRGVLLRPESWFNGTAAPRHYLSVLSCTLTTAIIVWAGLRQAGAARWRGLEASGRMIPVAGAVIAANAVLSFAYVKDDVLSVAGAFYALAAYAAARALLDAAGAWRRPAAAAAVAVLLIASCAWSIRSAGVQHVLRLQAFRQRHDWAVLPVQLRRAGRWPLSPGQQTLVDALRRDALDLDAPPAELFPEWTFAWWGD